MEEFLQNKFLIVQDLINLQKCNFDLKILLNTSSTEIQLRKSYCCERIQNAICKCKEYQDEHNDKSMSITFNRLITALNYYSKNL